MKIQHFFDPETYTLTYLVFDEKTKDALIIDPVLDYDPADSRISLSSFLKLTSFIEDEKLNVHYILETHAHADHLSSSIELKQKFPDAVLAIGEKIVLVQKAFKKIFNLSHSFKTDGSQFDRLLKHQEEFAAGSLLVKVLETPGHTPACVSYLIGDAIFTGDALFMPDYGTGRCDFPEGSALDLFHSIHDQIFALPEQTKVYVGHDYQPGGRDLAFQSTIGEEKAANIHLNNQTSRDAFVSLRESRDKTLNAPRLLLPSVQVNINGGRLPEPEENGTSYLKIPIGQDSES